MSVIVPVYNVEAYLEECLDSLLGQTLRALEVIVVDDGSTDGSRAIAERYATADRRVRVVVRANGGLGAARNTGLDHVRGEYLTFVDSDDVIPEDSYRRMVASLDTSGSDLAVGQIARLRRGTIDPLAWAQQLHDEDRAGVRPADHPQVLRDFYTPNKLYRTSFWRGHGFRFREVRIFEDQPLITAIYCAASRIDILRATTYLWRARSDGSSISQSMHGVAEIRERQRAIELTREVVERTGSPELAAGWRWTLIRYHLPHYLTHTGGEAFDAALEMTRAAVTEDEVVACLECQPDMRTLVWLAHTGDAADVTGWARRTSGAQRRYGVTWVDGTPYVDYPPDVLGDLDLPHDLLRMSPWQLVAKAALREFCLRDNGELEVSGRAYIDFVDPAVFPQVVTVVCEDRVSGRRVEVQTRPDERGWDESRAPHAAIRYDAARFVGGVPLSSLLPAGEEEVDWRFVARVDVNGFSGSARFRFTLPPGWTYVLIRELAADRIALMSFTREEGLRLRSIRVGGLAHSVVRADDEIVVAGHGGAPDQLILQPPEGERIAVPVAVTTEGAWSARIGVADLAAGKGEWRVSTLVGDVSRPLAIEDSTADEARRQGVLLRPGRWGQLLIAAAQRGAVITSIDVEADGVRLRGSTVGSVAPALALQSTRLRTRTVRPEAPGGFEVLLPFEYTEWGETHHGLLPLGSYTVAADDGVVQTTVPVSTYTMSTTTHLRTELVIGGRAEIILRVRQPLADDELGMPGQWRLQQRWALGDHPLRTAAVFQCLRGDVVGDSLLAVSEELHRVRPDIEQIWATEDHSIHVPAYSRRVIVRSEDWHAAFATSRWVLVNHELPDTFRKREGQVVVQTYHGHPFKLMGLARWQRSRVSATGIANNIAAASVWDYLLAPSPAAERAYREQFPIPAEVVTVGHPRNDVLVGPRAEAIRQRTRELLGLRPDDVAVLYAPTWRDYEAIDPWQSKMVDLLDPFGFAAALGDGFPLLLRGHPAHRRHSHRSEASVGIIEVTDHPEINDLILASDVGVFDYSSIRFDYAVTGKPMVFFVPDERVYLDAVGALFDYGTTTPGPHAHTLDELTTALKDLDAVRSGYAGAYEEFVQTFAPYDDGHAAERFVAAVFPDQSGEDGR